MMVCHSNLLSKCHKYTTTTITSLPPFGQRLYHMLKRTFTSCMLSKGAFLYILPSMIYHNPHKTTMFQCVCGTESLNDVRSRSVVASAEPAAAEGRLHGGAGGGSQEAPPCVPLHGPPAVRQAEETTGRVRTPGRSASCHHVIIYFCSQSGDGCFSVSRSATKKRMLNMTSNQLSSIFC